MQVVDETLMPLRLFGLQVSLACIRSDAPLAAQVAASHAPRYIFEHSTSPI